MTKSSSIVAVAFSAAALLSTMAEARVTDHRGTLGVCADGWVEQAPAHRPIAPAYHGDHFTIKRPKLALVHHSNGQIERFADGYLTHRDATSNKVFRYDGWISTRILTGGRSCP